MLLSIAYLLCALYSTDRGDRPDKPNIALLFTDGGSNDPPATLIAARRARVNGIKLVVIAVTNWINMNEVSEIKSERHQAGRNRCTSND